jgi:hypothetical protein
LNLKVISMEGIKYSKIHYFGSPKHSSISAFSGLSYSCYAKSAVSVSTYGWFFSKVTIYKIIIFIDNRLCYLLQLELNFMKNKNKNNIRLFILIKIIIPRIEIFFHHIHNYTCMCIWRKKFEIAMTIMIIIAISNWRQSV